MCVWYVWCCVCVSHMNSQDKMKLYTKTAIKGEARDGGISALFPLFSLLTLEVGWMGWVFSSSKALTLSLPTGAPWPWGSPGMALEPP